MSEGKINWLKAAHQRVHAAKRLARGEALASHPVAAGQRSRGHGKFGFIATVRLGRPDRATFDLVVLKGTVHAPPEVAIADRCHLPKAFPVPILLAPFLKAISQTSGNIPAARDQGHARRLIEGFEAAHDS